MGTVLTNWITNGIVNLICMNSQRKEALLSQERKIPKKYILLIGLGKKGCENNWH